MNGVAKILPRYVDGGPATIEARRVRSVVSSVAPGRARPSAGEAARFRALRAQLGALDSLGFSSLSALESLGLSNLEFPAWAGAPEALQHSLALVRANLRFVREELARPPAERSPNVDEALDEARLAADRIVRALRDLESWELGSSLATRASLDL